MSASLCSVVVVVEQALVSGGCRWLCHDGGGVAERLSKERVKRVGERLRAHQSGERPMALEALLVELDVVGRWRAAHAAPLTRVAANLRYYVAEASGGSFVVGQRLKRMETIRDKLDREPQMELSRMHDIAGARAVLADEGAVDQILARLAAPLGPPAADVGLRRRSEVGRLPRQACRGPQGRRAHRGAASDGRAARLGRARRAA